MTRYADPRRCPDCGTTIRPGSPTCPACALSLRGETAQRLFSTLSRADELLVALRAASVPVPAATTAAPADPFPVPPAYDDRTRREGSRLATASVPSILLALGAGCLLVAALVFLAVTWSALGVGGRTATLVVLTLVAGTAAAGAARRGLRAAAESLSVVALGLLGLDLVGADHAGWFGDLSGPGLAVLAGTVLLVTGFATTLLAAHRTTVQLVGCELVGALGAALLAGGLGWGEWLPVAPSLVLATLVAAAVTAGASLLRLRRAGVGTAAVTVVAWLSLTGYGADRVLAHDASWRELWAGAHPWPLLVAAALVAALVALRRLPAPAHVGAAAVAQLLVLVAALAPVEHLGATPAVLVGVGVLVLAAAQTWWLPRPWALVALLIQAVAAGSLLLVVVGLTAEAVTRLRDAAAPVWAGRAADRLPLAPRLDGLPAGWLLPVCVAALLVTALVLVRAVRRPGAVAAAVGALAAPVGAAALAGSLVAAASLYPVPVWLVVSGLLVAAAGLTAWWLAQDEGGPLALAALFVVAALGVALHADLLTADALLVLVGGAVAVHLRARSDGLAGLAAAVLSVAAASWVLSLGAVLDAQTSWVALAAVVLLGVLVLAAPYAPDRWWSAPRPVLARAGLEVGAAVGGVLASVVGVWRSPVGEGASWAAVDLTALGVVVSAMSLLRTDRRSLARVGGALLAAASWVRLADLGVRAPEAYTLPAAAALLVVGLVRLHRSPDSTTTSTLAPGLSLALVPSLLWVLEDPTGPRAVLLGLGCLLLVTGGARLGWTAPLTLGASVGAILVLRLAAPYVGDAVPRWVLIGAAGALLVAMGATWERRVTDAQHLATYVRALR